MIKLEWYIWLSAIMFGIGAFGFLTRRNIILMFVSVELMLNAANISLAAFSYYLHDMRGQAMVLFVIAVAAAEAAVGLAIILAMFRNRETTNADELAGLRW